MPAFRPVSLSVSPICPPQVGILFDVDGVLLRGGSVIPAARRAFRNLVDQNNNFRFPVVFVTNAGSCQRQHKAQQLSHLLEVQVGQTGAWVETWLYYRDSTAVTSLLPSCDLSLSLSLSRSPRSRLCFPTVLCRCSRVSMTSVCWCLDRDQWWTSPTRILHIRAWVDLFPAAAEDCG